MKMKYMWLLGLASISVAISIGLHQFIKTGQLFQLRDALHHEFFMALFGALGLGILVGSLLTIRLANY